MLLCVQGSLIPERLVMVAANPVSGFNCIRLGGFVSAEPGSKGTTWMKPAPIRWFQKARHLTFQNGHPVSSGWVGYGHGIAQRLGVGVPGKFEQGICILNFHYTERMIHG